MIQRDPDGGKGYVLTCDECGDSADARFRDFKEAVDWKKDKRNGWRSRKDKNGEWGDVCPICRYAR